MILFISPTKVVGQVIFIDGFNEVSPILWKASSNNLPTTGWVIENGMYGYPLPSVITTNSYPMNWDNTKKNISYEVDLLEVGGGVNKNILIKYVDDNNFVNVHSNGDGTYLAGYVDTDQKTYFSYFYPKILSNGEVHHYKIDISDNKITVYIDNELVFDHIEDTIMFPNWRIGLRTSIGSEAWFDNVIVTNLDTPLITKTVFAPGLMGSWNADAILNCKSETDTEWILAPYAEEVYNPVLTAIRESGWDTLPFYYDWRKPVAENSNKLADFLNSEDIAPNEKVNFVGHSMGGLVGRGYLQNSDGTRLSSLLTVGTPNKGSAYAYPPWEGGEIWSNSLIEKIALTVYLKHCGGLNQNYMEIIREQIPSVRDLLPTDPYLLRKKTSTTYLPDDPENQNSWINGLSQDSKGVRLGYVAGTGIDTVKTIQTKDPHKKDVMEELWTDGRPSGRIVSAEGDGTVLVTSATLPQANWNAVINQTHRGLVNSIEGMSKILEFLNLSKPSGMLSTNEDLFEPDSALVVIGYPANFVITDGSGKSKNSKDGMVAFMNPKSGNYKLNLISKSGNTTLIVAQFLPNGDVKYKEYNLKGIGPKFRTLKFDSQNLQEDILKP
jgi:pimeloyl-ACP methyl ester carboxylesterase